MPGQTIILCGPTQRAFAKSLIDKAPIGAICNIKKATRSNEQNAKMWAMLSDVSRAAPEDRLWDTTTWKAAFMHALGYEIQWQPGLNGQPFPAGFRTSKLNAEQMADLSTMIQEYGDRQGIQWSEPEVAA